MKDKFFTKSLYLLSVDKGVPRNYKISKISFPAKTGVTKFKKRKLALLIFHVFFAKTKEKLQFTCQSSILDIGKRVADSKENN